MIMAEHANRADRGRALGLGFGTMWPIGALAAALLKLLLRRAPRAAAICGGGWCWPAGALPAFAVLYFRRRMPETARFLARLAGDQAAGGAGHAARSAAAPAAAPAADTRPLRRGVRAARPPIFAAALLWMIYDLVVYAFILFGPNLIAGSLGMAPSIFSLMTQLLFVLPASVLGSLFVIDRLGRKPLQVWGFLGGAACWRSSR